jgi:hypothetical protein
VLAPVKYSATGSASKSKVVSIPEQIIGGLGSY